MVSEGDFVKADQPVALMSLPELEAKLQQVQAQERAAQAKQSLVDEGAVPRKNKPRVPNGNALRLQQL